MAKHTALGGLVYSDASQALEVAGYKVTLFRNARPVLRVDFEYIIAELNNPDAGIAILLYGDNTQSFGPEQHEGRVEFSEIESDLSAIRTALVSLGYPVQLFMSDRYIW